MTVIKGTWPDSGQPPSGGGGMDSIERLTKLETKLETLLLLLATKGDIEAAKSSIVMWLAGVIAASTAILIAVLAFMLNRALPIQNNPQQQPLIIYPQQSPAVQQPSLPAPQSPPDSKRGLKP